MWISWNDKINKQMWESHKHTLALFLIASSWGTYICAVFQENSQDIQWNCWHQITPLCVCVCVCVSELGLPTSVDLVSSEPAHMVTSFTTGHIGLFNMETQQLILKLESAGPPGKSTDQSQIKTHVMQRARGRNVFCLFDLINAALHYTCEEKHSLQVVFFSLFLLTIKIYSLSQINCIISYNALMPPVVAVRETFSLSEDCRH